ncbi:ATP-dependent helicase RIS1 [Plectosphaerella plurivora]|uniref:ATP-dependent helicase RIS1 n=1 Tax=Plectosphaerella plurivora TaxID=936078 RepID=A0A9P9A8M6_9PEZI|nr:ATP-dependent helicase RIS1 [Plectosphaerella plurivora]
MVNQRGSPKPLVRSQEDSLVKQASSKDAHRGAPISEDALTAQFDSLRARHPAPANTSARRTETPDVVEIERPAWDAARPARPSIPTTKERDDALSSFFSDKGRRDPFHTGHGHKFGPPGKIVSSLKQKAAGVFNERRSRPEHHRDSEKHRITAPAAPTYPDKKPDAPKFYSSIGPDANPATYKRPDTFGEAEFYTDPTKASADLKALLEGGMDEEEEEETESNTKKAEKIDGQIDSDGTLEGLKVKLLPHQVEGVEWMKGRELGPVKRGRVPKGGILADDMGLGKTLQTIAVILTNQKPAQGDKRWKKQFEGVAKTTLVVAPLALIRQWETEIKDKVEKSHGLKVCVHHGPQRTKKFSDLALYDVVVTTYQVLVSEHGHSSDEENGVKAGCFGLQWWRVVLDEAHSIKNRNAKSTKACYALRSEYRWCLSGTPMQNSLEELQSLIKFLRIRPYDNLAEWKDQIEKPLKNGKGHVAIRRLHSILRCFMKRRTKEILKKDGALNPGGKPTTEGDKSGPGFKVTERKIVKISASFSPAERRFYDRLEARADESLERMEKGGMNYVNALVLLLRLRQACNHPKLVEGKIDKDKDALSGDASQKTANASVDDLADMFGDMGIAAKTCGICGRQLPKDITRGNQDICQECYDDLAYFKENESTQRKKPVRSKGKKKALPQKEKKEAQAVLDSDDEEDEGDWLVPEDQQGQLRLGKAGGEEDENAEGGGEWLGDDSLQKSEDETEASNLDSFVVNEEPTTNAKAEADSDSEDSLASVSEIVSRAEKQKRPSNADRSRTVDDDSSSSRSSDDEDTGVDESDVDSTADDTVFHSMGEASQILASAKIRQMMQILHKEVHDHKFIVFSQFTSMMDLIEPFFRKEGFKFTRYDGGMKNDEREESLGRLRNDPNTRILLCSLKCGSLGLNLTAATRVIIVEPFWNPFIEEQAIDRVHRLTQTIDVVVYKLTVEQTVEERILDLQEKKRLLAETAIEGGMKKNVLKLGFNEIMDLFRRDHQGDQRGGGDADGPAIEPRGPILKAKPKKTEDSVYGRRW